MTYWRRNNKNNQFNKEKINKKLHMSIHLYRQNVKTFREVSDLLGIKDLFDIILQRYTVSGMKSYTKKMKEVSDKGFC